MTPDTIITALDGSHHIFYFKSAAIYCRTWCGKSLSIYRISYAHPYSPQPQPTPVCEDCLELFVSFEESKYA
jgi:hypothetical protein